MKQMTYAELIFLEIKRFDYLTVCKKMTDV